MRFICSLRAVPAGTSSISRSSLKSSFLAPAGGVEGEGMPRPAHRSSTLDRRVYCGAAVTALLVITYLRGIGLLADLDPDLPVGVRVAEGEMIALDAVDDAVADVFGLDHVFRQFL